MLMFRCLCKKLFLFSVWTMFSIVALPVFAQTPAAGSTSNEWTPANWIALVTAISGLIVAVIGALKGTAAQKTANDNTSRLNEHEGRITNATQTGSSAQSKADANEQRLNAVANRL